MNQKVLRSVEYTTILERLASLAQSAPGKELCLSLSPMRDLVDIEKAQGETQAAVALLDSGSDVNFGSNRDITEVLRALKIQSSLTAPELLHLASFLENVARVKLSCPEDQKNPLFDLFDCLYPLSPLSQEIRRCILAEDQIADDASPELKRIRRQRNLTDDKIHQLLSRLVTQTYSSYLQDTVITMRDDRYCLPVKAEYKSQVKGIVHDASSTGSTLFIEPAGIVELGNAMRQYDVEEKKEIAKILSDLSLMFASHVTELSDDAKNLTTLDFIFAKARLAISMDAVRPVFNENHIVRLYGARHPLIDKKRVVPITLTIGEDYDMIVITGPNTGGKTVTLKTVGLLEVMGMAGLAIPASEHSELSVFRQVYADIGDEQSIEQNLSTFSAHMTSIVGILKRCDANCLCLFDELGSGTDPTEGAALAISILTWLHERHITAMATTHYAELKVFAMQTKGITNASCEFDVETLQPTYRLLIGVPGKSNAFAISEKLGLSRGIIENAKKQLTNEQKNLEDVLSQLEDERTKARKEKEEADERMAQVLRKEKILTDREEKLEEKKQKILDKANEEARDILQDAKHTADRAISEVRKSGRSVDIDTMEQQRTLLRTKANERAGKIKTASLGQNGRYIGQKKELKASDLHLGDRVRILSMGMTGTVESKPDKDGNLEVRCGILNTNVNLKDVALVDEETGQVIDPGLQRRKQKKPAPDLTSRTDLRGVDLSRSMNISSEISLIGMTVDEAIPALDKYLDDARMSHLDSVRVVHGKGTGALRTAVHEYLRKQKWVKSYHDGAFGEGDAGVTIVEL